MVRPTQQSSTKRKFKSNDLIWARDGDHKNAQEHPAYILENCNEEDTSKNDNDEVWVEWSSNGTVACIPKSRISTTVLSSRRRRHNNGRKQPSNNNDSEPISNDTIANDNLPSVSDSKAKKESIQVKREDVKVKEEGYGGETDNDDEDRKIAAVPTPVVSLHPKKEEYEEDTDDDVALDQVQSTHVQVKGELEESTDDEGVAPDPVQSTGVKVEEAGEDTDDEGTTPDPILSADFKEGEVTLSQIRLNQLRVKLKQKKQGRLQNSFIPKSAQSTREKEDEEEEEEEEEGEDVDNDDTGTNEVAIGQSSHNTNKSSVAAVESKAIKKNSYKLGTIGKATADYWDEIEKQESTTKHGDSSDGANKSIEKLQYLVPDQILVEGCMFTKSRVECCPLSNINGTYYPVARLSKANAPVYSKRGEWKGKAVDLVIRRNKNDNGWVIYHWKGNVNHSGWKAKWYHIDGKKLHDEPTLKYGYNTSEIWEKSPMVSAKIMQEWGYDSDMYDKSETESSVDEDDPWNYEDESDDTTYSIANLESNIEEFIKSARVYLWCESYGELLLLPYNYYLFWRVLNQCQTWGEIRRLCYGKNKRCYEWLLERYETKYDRFKYKMDKEFNVDMLTDNKAVCMDDFNLGDHIHYDLPGSGVFPPLIEQVMEEASYFDETRCGWMLDWADLTFSREYDSLGLRFDLKDKDAIFKKVEDLGRTIRLRYSSKLSWFESRFDYGWKT